MRRLIDKLLGGRGRATATVTPHDERTAVDVSRSTDFGELRVFDTEYMGEEVRMLTVNGTQESAAYREPGRHGELVFQYTRSIAQILPGHDRALLIGGAGCSIAKYFVDSFPEGHIDVAELHGEMIELARRYFFLGEFESERMRIHVGDGAELLGRRVSDGAPGYDIIINDAYVGDVLDAGLQSERGMRLIHSALTPGGLYCLNIITAMEGYLSMGGLMQEQLAMRHFANVRLCQCNPRRDRTHRQNCLLLASDGELPEVRGIY